MTRPTSQINYAAIATNYPVAGKDNNSQGFRDNFTAISAGLAQAKIEISELQSNSVLIADLSANTAVVNNMLGSTIYNALYSQFNGVFYNGGTVSAPVNIDLNNGPVQKFNLAGAVTLTFTNWPSSGNYGSVRVIFSNDGAAVYTPTLSTANAGSIRYDSSFPNIPGTTTPGIYQGQKSVASVIVTNPGTGFTSAASISFTPGTLATGGTAGSGSANYKVLTATVSNGGNGYSVGDSLTLVSNNSVVFTVNTINTTFTATTSIGSPTLTGVTDFRNLAAGVAISGSGIPSSTTILSVNSTTGQVTMSNNASATGSSVTVTYTSSTGPIGAVTVSPNGVFSAPITVGQRVASITGTGSGGILSLNFGINAINVTNSGSGYISTPPTVVITGGGGTPTASATLTTNNLSSVDVIEASTVDGGANVFVRYLGKFVTA